MNVLVVGSEISVASVPLENQLVFDPVAELLLCGDGKSKVFEMIEIKKSGKTLLAHNTENREAFEKMQAEKDTIAAKEEVSRKKLEDEEKSKQAAEQEKIDSAANKKAAAEQEKIAEENRKAQEAVDAANAAEEKAALARAAAEKDPDISLNVFTPRAETLWAASMLIYSEHEDEITKLDLDKSGKIGVAELRGYLEKIEDAKKDPAGDN